jgi:hypothetical protein
MKQQSLSDPSVMEAVEHMAAAANGIGDSRDWQRALAMLDERIADDELIRKLLVLEQEGVTKASTQATQLKIAIELVYKARRRLAAHREVVRQSIANDGIAGNAHEHNQNGMR